MLKRWKIYFDETFPIGERFLAAVLITNLLWLKLNQINTTKIWNIKSQILGSIILFFMLLYYRLCDEYKDQDTDEKFFPSRAIPSGRVLLKDITYLIYTTLALSALLAFFIPQALAELVFLWIFLYLMSKWFYIPQFISNNRIMAFITHAPSSFFYHFFVLALYPWEDKQDLYRPTILLLAAWAAMPGLVWELLRKTWSPQDEMEGYQTYSSMLGYKGSSLLALLIAYAHLAISFFSELKVTIPMRGILIANCLFISIIVFRFISKPVPQGNFLKRMAEIYMVVTMLALAGDFYIQ